LTIACNRYDGARRWAERPITERERLLPAAA